MFLKLATFSAAIVAVTGCAPRVSLPTAPLQAPSEAPSASQDFQKKVDALDEVVRRYLVSVDQALWNAWTTGSSLDSVVKLEPPPELLSQKALPILDAAMSVGASPVRAANLRGYIAGLRLARATAAEAEAISAYEASATFIAVGREVRWRDLERVLMTEPNAAKRRLLWSGGAEVASRVAALRRQRAEAARPELTRLRIPDATALWATTRGLDTSKLKARAQALLAGSTAAWEKVLEGRMKAEGITEVAWADLPRLFRVPTEVDRFVAPGEKLARDSLSALGLEKRKGFQWDLGDAATKQPLPLVLSLARNDVRVSWKPVAGLRPARMFLGTVGIAVALGAVKPTFASAMSLTHMGDPARGQSVAFLFEDLFLDKEWLMARGFDASQADGIVAAARMLRLYELRRACLSVLVQLESLSEEELPARVATLAELALGVKATPSEGKRIFAELNDDLRSGTWLTSAAAAALLRQSLAAKSWPKPEAVRALDELLVEGISVRMPPLDERAGEAIVASYAKPLE